MRQIILSTGVLLIIIFSGLQFYSSIYAENENTPYHSYYECVNELYRLSATYPSITYLFSIGKTYEGRDILVLKISDNPKSDEDEPELLFIGNIHAREWLSMEVPIYIANTLIEGYETNETIRNIVNEREIFILPCLNPDGRMYDSPGDNPKEHSTHGEEGFWVPGWRKNRIPNGDGTFGVDLNRNFGYMWGGISSPDQNNRPITNTSSDGYRGRYPFSEKETQALRDFVKEHEFVFAISYHSYGQDIIYPWSYTKNKTIDYELFHAIATRMAELMGNNAGSTTGYTPRQSAYTGYKSGTEIDWFYGAHGIYAFTVELFPGKINGNDETLEWGTEYDYYHPPADKVIPVCEDNIESAIYLAKIADNPYQAMDYHIQIYAPSTITMNKNDVFISPISILNDGRFRANYTLSVTSSPNIHAYLENITLYIVTTDDTHPGYSFVWVNATGDFNISKKIHVFVRYEDDVGVSSVDIDENTVNARIENRGMVENTVTVSCKIEKKIGVTHTTVDITNYREIDMDGDLSDSRWQYKDGKWIINGKDNTIDILLSDEIDLQYVHNPKLKITHTYRLPTDTCFGNVDIWINNTPYWIYGFTGSETDNISQISLSDFIDKKIRIGFRLSSIDECEWIIQDVKLMYDKPNWKKVYENNKIITVEPDELETISWQYLFNKGLYQVTVNVFLRTDMHQMDNSFVTFYENKNIGEDKNTHGLWNIYIPISLVVIGIIIAILVILRRKQKYDDMWYP